MNETDIRNVVGPLLSTGDKIIWVSPTDPKAKFVLLDELKQHAKNQAKNYLYGAVFVALLMVFVLFMGTHPQERIGDVRELIAVVVVLIGLDVIRHFVKVWMTKRDKIGGYAPDPDPFL